MTMPDPGASLHNRSLDYYCTFASLQAAAGPVTFSCPDPVRFRFAFETGSTPNADGSVTWTWSYTWFSQAAQEASIKTALNSICTAVATLLGLTLAQVQAAVTVRRVWTMAPNTEGGAVSSGTTVLTSTMAYP